MRGYARVETQKGSFDPAPTTVPAVMSGKYSVLGSLIGLAGGLLAGGAIHASPAGALRWLVPPADVLGNLWLNTLQMLALPLTLAAVIGALTSRGSLKAAGHITGGALFLFFLLLALAGAFTAILSPLVISWLHVDTRTLAALGAAATGAALPAGITPTSFSMSDLILSLIPRNVLRAALDMELLPLLVLSMLFGFALNRTRNAAGMAVIRVIQGFTDALFVLVGWVIRLSPAGVFALSLSFAAGLGFNLSAVLGKFVILSCSLLLAFTLLMYPAGWLLGGIAPRKFAAAILPAQVTAVGTRSSMACLPAMLEASEAKLRLDPAVVRITLPLAVSLFKVNRPISSTARLFFVACLYGIPLGPDRVAVFILSVMLISLTYPGLPGTGSSFRTLPAYLAAGMPIQGIVLFEAVEVIVDIFKTLLNVTADVAVTTILSRFCRARGVSVINATAGPETLAPAAEAGGGNMEDQSR